MGDFTTAGEVESVTAHEVINKIEKAEKRDMVIRYFTEQCEEADG